MPLRCIVYDGKLTGCILIAMLVTLQCLSLCAVKSSLTSGDSMSELSPRVMISAQGYSSCEANAGVHQYAVHPAFP